MAAAVPPELQALRDVLDVCGIPQAERDRLIAIENLTSIQDLTFLDGDRDVSEWAKRMESRRTVADRVVLGMLQVKRLQALVYWAKDRMTHGVALTAAEFDNAAMEETMRVKAARREAKETHQDPAVKDLGTFDPNHFELFEDAFLNLLSLTASSHPGESLRYVVRPEEEPEDFETDEQRRMFQLPLEGEAYALDNRKVYKLLKAFLVETPGYVWISEQDSTENGRRAYRSWSGHYNGEGELSKRVTLAETQIKEAFYKNEQSFSFEHYTEVLKKAFRTLQKEPDVALSGRQQVEALLAGIKTDNVELLSAKSVIQQNYPRDFSGACAYFSQRVSSIYGVAQLEKQRTRQGKRRISALGRGHPQRGGRGRGRFGGRDSHGRGRGGRHGGGRGNYINGIDVSNVTRSFSPEEWDQLRADGRDYVNNARNRAHARGRGRGDGGGRGGGGRNVSATQASGGGNRNNQDQQEEQPNGNNERGGTNGRGFGRGAYGGRGGGRG